MTLKSRLRAVAWLAAAAFWIAANGSLVYADLVPAFGSADATACMATIPLPSVCIKDTAPSGDRKLFVISGGDLPSAFASNFPRVAAIAVSDKMPSNTSFGFTPGVNVGGAVGDATVNYILENEQTGKPDPGGAVVFGGSLAAVGVVATDKHNGGSGSAMVTVFDPANGFQTLLRITANASGGFTGDFTYYQSLSITADTGHSVSNNSVSQFSGKETFTATTGFIGVSFSASAGGYGAAGVDPVFTAVNPNDILVSVAPTDANPSLPLFTSDELAGLQAQGADLSPLISTGLVGSPVPEPGTILLLGTCLLGLGATSRHKFSLRQRPQDIKVLFDSPALAETRALAAHAAISARSLHHLL